MQRHHPRIWPLTPASKQVHVLTSADEDAYQEDACQSDVRPRGHRRSATRYRPGHCYSASHRNPAGNRALTRIAKGKSGPAHVTVLNFREQRWILSRDRRLLNAHAEKEW